MFCSNCGSKLNNNPKFCSNCGADLSKYQQDSISQSPNPNPIYPPKPQPLWQEGFGLDTSLSKKATRLPGPLTLSSVNQPTKFKEGNMIKFVWLAIISGVIIIKATTHGFTFALGYVTAQFGISMVFSPIWWIIAKSGRTTPWQWYDWLNAGAYIMVGLQILGIITEKWVQTQIGG